jgi:solute carrier family 35 protein E3
MNGMMLMSLLLNVVSSVGVIFINKKLVFNAAGFHFGTTLTIIHFVVTAMGCAAFARGGCFEWKKLELRQVLTISLAFCGYVVFNNLSLLANSVGFYQITKILCTPVIVMVERVYYGKRESTATLLALVPVCIGIGITVYGETTLNAMGILWAGLAVISNSLYTIWGKTKQQDLKVTPMQILSYQAPLSATLLLFTVPLMDNMKDLTHYDVNMYRVTCILLSCIFAFGVNFSFFLFVGQTSPLTTNVLGYLKTCLVFIGGFVLFDDNVTLQSGCGIAVTMLGLALYSKAKLTPQPALLPAPKTVV